MIFNDVKLLIDEENGAAAVEYAIMVSLIAGLVVTAVTSLGLSVNGLFQRVGNPFE